MVSLQFRTIPCEADKKGIADVLASSGFFYEFEIGTGVELIEEALNKGPASGYNFLFAEANGELAGYTCYGEIPCTVKSYDLYWIAVHEKFRAQGVGKVLMNRTEDLVRAAGGRKIYIETSSRELYLPTREFYLRCGYPVDATLKDFYGPLDDKCIFSKTL